MIWVLWGHCALTSVCSPSRILRMFSAPVTRTTGRPSRWVLKTLPYRSRRELWKWEPWGRAVGQPRAPNPPSPSRPRTRRPAPHLEQPVQGLPEEGPAHGALRQGQGAGAVPAEAPAQRPQVPAQGEQQRQSRQRQRRRRGPGEPRRHPPAGAARAVPAPPPGEHRGRQRAAGRSADGPLPAAGPPGPARLLLPVRPSATFI